MKRKNQTSNSQSTTTDKYGNTVDANGVVIEWNF